MTPARSARSKHALVCLLMGLSLALSSCVYMPIGPSGSRAPDAVGDGNQTAGSAGTPEASPAPPPPASYVLIIDASGSMKIADMVGGGDRMTAARDAAKRFVSELPEGSKVALVTYGDQTPEDAPRETSCEDATVKIPLGTARDGFAPLLDGLQPSGWTSISTALTKAAELAPAGERTSVVLVSDGEDSCAPPDPCDTAGDLVSKNAGLSISTIGVRANNTQLACIADRGRGISVTADSAAQLARRLLALSDPAAAADQLSPNGVQRIRPGTAYAAIKEQHPDFPALPESVESVIRVIWRNCAWEFDNQAILRGIVLNEGSTIDGIKLQDPAQILDGLGTPVQVDPVEGGELRYYEADERLGLAWKVTVIGGKVTTIVLCTCLPVAPCPPPNEEIRRLQNDPLMQIHAGQCTPDRNWAVITASFESIQRGGFLVMKRQGAGWEKVIRLTHQGNCFSMPADAPLEQLAPLVSGMCEPALVRQQFKEATLTTAGFGPLKIGMPVREIELMEVAQEHPSCKILETTALMPHEDLWLEVHEGRLSSIFTINPAIRTPSGAHVGMSLAELQRIYPGKLQARTIPAEGGARQSYVYVSGRQEIEFSFGHDYRPLTRMDGMGVSRVGESYVGGC